jgi:hypothetical protein
MADSGCPLPCRWCHLQRASGRLNLQRRCARSPSPAVRLREGLFLNCTIGNRIVSHRFDETHLTAARQLGADGVRRYLVWIRRGSAVAVNVYEAPSAEDAKRQAADELREVEAVLSRV